MNIINLESKLCIMETFLFILLEHELRVKEVDCGLGQNLVEIQ